MLEEVLEEAKALVVPDEPERRFMKALAAKVLERVREEAEKSEHRPKVVLGGSVAKGTWLKGEADVDVFLKFPKDVGREVLEDEGIRIGMEALKEYKPYLRYAEQPYVECMVKGRKVNVVCCYDVGKGEWRTVADRSPFHVELVSSMPDEQKDEVRLLKRFMKTLGIYGAEISVQGFSGFSCEVLVMKFGSFLEVLRKVSELKEGDVNRILLDPIDPRRNLAAAISKEAWAKLILASRAFLRRPSLDYFTPRVAKGPKYGEILEGLELVVFNHSKRSPDVLWGQLKRSLRRMKEAVSRAGFGVVRASCSTDEVGESAFSFILLNRELPKHEVRMGPKVFMKEDVERFLKKNREKSKLFWIEGFRIYMLKDRDFTSFSEFFSRFRDNPLGIAPGLLEEFSKTARLYEGRDALEIGCGKDWMKAMIYGISSEDELVFGGY